MNFSSPLVSKKFSSILPLASVILATAGFAHAASISYVGTQDNMETKDNDPTVGWRRTTPVKTLDIDGDNVVGTDGYRTSNRSANPAYATATVVAPNINNFSRIDDPNSTTADVQTGALHDASAGLGVETVALLEFVITGAIPVGETLRVGILMDSVGSALGTNSATYTLKQTVGGSATATTPVLTYQDGSLDVAYFDVTSPTVGDTFVVTSTTSSTNTEFSNAFEQVIGIAFDTGVIGTPGPTDPKITSFAVSGDTATVTMTGDDAVDYWCASSTDLTGFTTEETALETGTATPIPSPFNTSGGTLTFDVDVTGDNSLFLRIQDTDPNP